MKTVDTKEYISMLRTLIEEGKQVSMIISGSSMAPFLIHARDHICLKSPSGELRKGDMVFYQRSNGEYVMHRIYNVKKEEYYKLPLVIGVSVRKKNGDILLGESINVSANSICVQLNKELNYEDEVLVTIPFSKDFK